MTATTIQRIAAILLMLGVILGAFGAHSLANMLQDAHLLDIYQKGVFYHFIHALGILGIGILAGQQPNRRYGTAAMLLLAGIVCFSGSLYLLATRSLLGVEWSWLGPITPLGGLCFIAGWALLAVTVGKKQG